MPKGKRRKGGADRPPPKDQKVTARFSDEEFKRLDKLSRSKGENLSALVRGLVIETIDEVRAELDRRR